MGETKIQAANRFFSIQKICFAGILIALGVVGSMFSFPVFGSKCVPVQHMINVIAGVTLGPVYAVIMAFITSLLRYLFGLGTLLAFPGSMVGAFLCGIAFKCVKYLISKLPKKSSLAGYLPLIAAFFGETIGTGVLGGMLACPVARLFRINEQAAVLSFVIPFLVSTVVGAAVAMLFLTALKSTKAINHISLFENMR